MSKFNVRMAHRAKDEEVVDADYFSFSDGFVLFKKGSHVVGDQTNEVVAAFEAHGVEVIKKVIEEKVEETV